NLIAAGPQAATVAIADVFNDLEQRIAGRCEGRKFHDGFGWSGAGAFACRPGWLAIQGLDAEILVELEILADDVSVHWRRAARGANSKLHRKCGRRWRASR